MLVNVVVGSVAVLTIWFHDKSLVPMFTTGSTWAGSFSSSLMSDRACYASMTIAVVAAIQRREAFVVVFSRKRGSETTERQ